MYWHSKALHTAATVILVLYSRIYPLVCLIKGISKLIRGGSLDRQYFRGMTTVLQIYDTLNCRLIYLAIMQAV